MQWRSVCCGAEPAMRGRRARGVSRGCGDNTLSEMSQMQNAKCKMQRRPLILLCIWHFAFCIPLACQRKGPLTAQRAAEIIQGYQFSKEPVYAEVPQRVWWSAKAPQDDYD